MNVKYDVNYRHNKHFGLRKKEIMKQEEDELKRIRSRRQKHSNLIEAPPYEFDLANGDVPFSESFSTSYGFLDNNFEHKNIEIPQNSSLLKDSTGNVNFNASSSGSSIPLSFYLNTVWIITVSFITLFVELENSLQYLFIIIFFS